MVNVNDMPFNSRTKILVRCDKCNTEQFIQIGSYNDRALKPNYYCNKCALGISANTSKIKIKDTEDNVLLFIKYYISGCTFVEIQKFFNIGEKPIHSFIKRNKIDMSELTLIKNHLRIKSKLLKEKNSAKLSHFDVVIEKHGVEILTDYKNKKETISSLSRKYSVSKEALRKYIVKNGQSIHSMSVSNSISKNGKRYDIDTATLYDLYVVQEKSTQDIAEMFNKDKTMINKLLRNKGIEIRKNNSPITIKRRMEKAFATNLRRYGTKYASQYPAIKEKIAFTCFRNNSAPTSSQQKYLHSFLGGELNYPISHLNLDIAFPNENIYIEGDFSGHWISIDLNHITEKEFHNKEIKRYYFLKSMGWKSIKIISRKDYLPSPEKLNEMMILARKYFESGRGWIEYDIDNHVYRTSLEIEDYDYSKLVRVSKKNFSSIMDKIKNGDVHAEAKSIIHQFSPAN
ncbi:hypothetical protein IFU39_16890 [Paenibacillus sp. CFBP 13594]|uniref:hypothetical protein n=1 Tax=Paenibacillus sp. CFBP 13594 TaxID=2774037 RepID=UPI00177DB4FF|nr:hypothetical protein [Paenibacillus sp. CFBP 13594]MBD8839491.1 hypothetical protein [Paenibacillus sp. CFBP 13594]